MIAVRLGILALLGAVAIRAAAEPPPDLAFQGRLLDAGGAPLAGPVELELRIFDQPVDGSLLYAETHAGVPLRAGVFHLLLGTGALPVGVFDAELFSGQNRYLEVVVDGEVLAPRQPFSSVAFALQSSRAARADQVGSLAPSVLVTQDNLAASFSAQVTEISESQVPATLVREGELASETARLDAVDAALSARVSALEADKAALEARLAALEALLQGVTRNADTLVLSGMNLQLVNGLGSTASQNALGNLIIGYNEARSPAVGPTDRSGSHNLVVGSEHNYGSYGGLVAGSRNQVSAPFASVSGGFGNQAGASFASVSGGQSNQALGAGASVSGGLGNTAGGPQASIAGGEANSASGAQSAVAGGSGNLALALHTSVLGGISNRAEGSGASVAGGEANRSIGNATSVVGGRDNVAEDAHTSVAGGLANRASGTASAVLAGRDNQASGTATSVTGGRLNVASGDGTSISGGLENRASGLDAASVSGGRQNFSNGVASSILGGQGNFANGAQATVSGGQTNLATGSFSSVSGGQGRAANGVHDWRAGGLLQDF